MNLIFFENYILCQNFNINLNKIVWFFFNLKKNSKKISRIFLKKQSKNRWVWLVLFHLHLDIFIFSLFAMLARWAETLRKPLVSNPCSLYPKRVLALWFLSLLKVFHHYFYQTQRATHLDSRSECSQRWAFS